ncbi:UDP-glucose 4-epimerase [Kingella potus]|uniref:UDP-glucose 4-epimerase n=1 Tax=Kingella potus TaxID=265175 RepID=A0A377R1V2_9NEIS|nr:nucleoside-diphosphate sugar epimerase/dehydratase [Kingella potus]STR02860.1 UDP-glucose 4-epimerase [Kingella potus]
MLETLLSLPRHVKKMLFVVHDLLLVFCAFWFTQSLKADYDHEWYDPANWYALAATLAFTVPLFARLGLYRAVTRYISLRILAVALFGSFASMLAFFFSVLVFERQLRLALPVVYFFLLVVLIAGSRLLLRLMLAERSERNSAVPVIIYGAGQSGRQLAEAVKQVNEYRAAAFVDDNPRLQDTIVNDLPVYAPAEIEKLIARHGVKKILLAIPSAPPAARKAILSRLEAYPCEVLAIPGMKDLVDGGIHTGVLKKISVADLLGREPVDPDAELMSLDIAGKSVMVTGAGGSIGSELCRQILALRPARLVLFELSEFALYTIEQELDGLRRQHGIGCEILPLLGSVQDTGRLKSVIAAFAVDTVYHAAAYKHVPLVALNTIEGIRNNVFGTLACAQAAQEGGVSTFVLISTDKAVRPTNTMGAGKRMAELVLQALAAEPGCRTRFCMVRFGNVLGSSGSVVPAFERQIARGGPVSLTHPDITRYFMTIPEAAQLVIQAGAMGKGGDVFVLDMGESVKIIDLARRMIRLSGLEVKDENHPHGDIEIRITGLRPGEKLYEELLIGDNVSPTRHPRILTAAETMLPWPQLGVLLDGIAAACETGDQAALRRLLVAAPAAFRPQDGICDLVWTAQQGGAGRG